MNKNQPKRHGKGGWGAWLIRFAAVTSVLAFAFFAGGFTYGAYIGFGGSANSSSNMGGSGIGEPTTGKPAAGGPAADKPTTGESTKAANAPGSTENQNQPTKQQANTIHLVALGDSLTHGTGDASGLGYVGNVSNSYRQAGYHVIESNLGINGLTSSGLLTEVQQPSTKNLIQSADIILISIGGNDLNGAAGLPDIVPTRINEAQNRFEKNLSAILTNMRQANHMAPIILIGLYNPYGDVQKAVRQTDAIVESWDSQEQDLASTFPRTIVVQTYDLFQLHPTQFLYGDNFHPNQAGYGRIAARIWQDLQG